MITKPIEVKAISNYIIWVKFSDQTEGQVDLSYLITKPIFKAWQNSDFFNKVYIDKETNAIAWDENIELCPDNIYLKLKGISFEEWRNSQNLYATD